VASLGVGVVCASTWAELRGVVRPTQPAVGHAYVETRRKDIFATKKKARDWLGSHAVPAVFGPQGKLYVVDRATEMAALELTGNNRNLWTGMDVMVDLVDDLRNYTTQDDFWAEMRKRRYVSLLAPGKTPLYQLVPIDPGDLPTTWVLGKGGFRDDAWRSLVAFATTQADHSSRCYVRTCRPFQDFQWAYLFHDSVVGLATDLWSSQTDLLNFEFSFADQQYPADLSRLHTNDWKALGESLSAHLCHQSGVVNFTLPAEEFPVGSPEGFVGMGDKMPEDPTCWNVTGTRAGMLV